MRARAQDRPAVRGDLDLPELRLADGVGDLDVGAEPDPHLDGAAGGPTTSLLLPKLVVAGRVEEKVERALACAASGRPAPRIEVVGVVIVTTETHEASTFGIA